MSEEVKSFLISFGVLLAIALFIPCIESIAMQIRRRSNARTMAKVTEISRARSARRKVA